MNLERFIEIKISEMIIKELSSFYDKNEITKTYNKVYALNNGTNNLLVDFVELLKDDFDLSLNLPKSKKYIDLYSLSLDKLVENHLEFLDSRINKGTKDKLIIALWVLAKIEYFSNDEYLDIEVAEFYNKVFTEYEFLLDIDNFFNETDILRLVSPQANALKTHYIPVFENAVSNNSNSLEIKKILANSYYNTGQFDKSEKIISEIIDKLDSENLDFNDYESLMNSSKQELYLEMLQVKALINYDLKNYKNTLEFTDFIINNLPNYPKFDDSEQHNIKYIDDVIPALILNISSNLKLKTENNNTNTIELLTNGWAVYNSSDWSSIYPETVEYISDLKQ